jgi:hypothetical protein
LDRLTALGIDPRAHRNTALLQPARPAHRDRCEMGRSCQRRIGSATDTPTSCCSSRQVTAPGSSQSTATTIPVSDATSIGRGGLASSRPATSLPATSASACTLTACCGRCPAELARHPTGAARLK